MSTVSPSSAKLLCDWLAQTRLLQPRQADELRPALAGYRDGHALAKDLVQRGWITPYQANQILVGKGNDLILGDYRLRERVGEGAMGQVFKAWNLRLEAPVALKMIHKDHVESAKAMERFRREIEAASHLDHPNIVLVRDADEIEGRPYMVMDFIDGVDLSRMVKMSGPLPVAEAVEYARQTALGLQHAFERGVVHRDIKPGNLFLTRGPDQTPLVKILDFGLARFESERDVKNRLTMLGAILGTVDYIAPEQAENAHKADIRADIFSLGCTLYYLLTGKPPYPGNTVVEKVTNRLLGDATPVTQLRRDVPAGLEGVLKKMMARKPEDRFQTPLETALALQMYSPVGVLAFNSNLLRLPALKPSNHFPLDEHKPDDPLAFSASNHELNADQLMDRARHKTNTLSRGSARLQSLMANKAFVWTCVGGFAFLVLLAVLIVALSR